MTNYLDLEIGLLGFLLEKQMHGYELYKKITDLSGIGIVWRVKTGKLYVMLKKLEDAGLITSEKKREGNRPQKNDLIITEKGIDEFFFWVGSPVKHGRDFRIKFLLKLYFSITMDKEKSFELIEKQENECRKWLERFNNRKTDNQKSFNKIVNNYRTSQILNLIRWLAWCRGFLMEKES